MKSEWFDLHIQTDFIKFLHNCSSANHIPKELPKSWEKEKNEKCLHACFCQIRLWGLLYSSQLLHSSYFLSWFFVSGMKMKFILLRDVSFVIVNVFQNCNKLVGFCFLLFSVMLFGNNFPYISLLENRFELVILKL